MIAATFGIYRLAYRSIAFDELSLHLQPFSYEPTKSESSNASDGGCSSAIAGFVNYVHYMESQNEIHTT